MFHLPPLPLILSSEKLVTTVWCAPLHTFLSLNQLCLGRGKGGFCHLFYKNESVKYMCLFLLLFSFNNAWKSLQANTHSSTSFSQLPNIIRDEDTTIYSAIPVLKGIRVISSSLPLPTATSNLQRTCPCTGMLLFLWDLVPQMGIVYRT